MIKETMASRSLNIFRIDNPVNRTHTWRVTLQRRGEIILRHFSDGVYGGKRAALKAARAFHASLLEQHSSFEHRIWVRTRLRRNNRSGIPGVGRYEVRDGRSGKRRRAFWLASWIDEHGASRKRKFGVTRYGEREAKRRAIATREKELARVCAILANSNP